MSAASDTTSLTQPTTIIPFGRLSADDIPKIIDTVIDKARLDLGSIKDTRAPRTFSNTMIPLDNLGVELDFAYGIISHIESVATTSEWRTAYNAIVARVTEFKSSILLDHDLWQALKTFADTEEAKNLSGHRKRYLEKNLALFRKSGADLDVSSKTRLNEINTALANITNSFSQKTLDATNAFEYITEDPRELAGLPQSALTMGKTSAQSRNLQGWRFTLHAPSVIAIMTYADNQELRERFYRAHHSRCSGGEYDNIPAIDKILELRREKAKLLGFSDFSDLVLSERMAKNGNRAKDFLLELRSKVEPFFKREIEELQSFLLERYGIEKDALKPWDVAYYVEKMRKERYDFDEEQLRPYFALPKVTEGLFEVARRVFGIIVSPNPQLPTWDKDVKGYSAYDESSGALLGTFYSDLFPRENKRGGAWMNTLLARAACDSSKLHHVGLIAGNFTPPSDDTPALLTHDEVTTLFHEFGHLLHLLCNKTELRSQSMDSVAWDFIELPSQLLEGWCWERESLDIFAAHYQDNSKLPDELLVKILKARNFRNASHYMRQLGFSFVDLALHREYSPSEHGPVSDYCRGILNQFTPIELPDYSNMIATFTHIFGSPVGYGAGYYSYLWAEVLDADAFSRFEEDGILNLTTGLLFRDTVLSSGDEKDPEDILFQFMGRNPSLEALLKRAGLV